METELDESAIPPFREDGYLPEGLYVAPVSEVVARFGVGTRTRRRLGAQLQRWVELARGVNAARLLIDGSFITSKRNPGDLDAVILLPRDFNELIGQGNPQALELEHLLLSRHPPELFAAEDEADWEGWRSFFSRTRERDARRKGLVVIYP